MATLPTTGDDLDLITFVMGEQPGYTHKLDIDRQRVSGMTDKRDALYQAIYLIRSATPTLSIPAITAPNFRTS